MKKYGTCLLTRCSGQVWGFCCRCGHAKLRFRSLRLIGGRVYYFSQWSKGTLMLARTFLSMAFQTDMWSLEVLTRAGCTTISRSWTKTTRLETCSEWEHLKGMSNGSAASIIAKVIARLAQKHCRRLIKSIADDTNKQRMVRIRLRSNQTLPSGTQQFYNSISSANVVEELDTT